MKKLTATFLLSSLICLVSSASITDFKVNRMDAPLGIDTPSPLFSWKMSTEGNNPASSQRAYRITVTDENGDTLWNSGTTDSQLSSAIRYQGNPLKPRSRYACRLTVTDNKGKESTATTSFETGVMGNGLEGASWIGADSLSLPLYSRYLPVFAVDYTVSSEAPLASFFFGANDPRMQNPHLNLFKIAASADSSFYALTLDTGSLKRDGHATLTLSRNNYAPADKESPVIATFEVPDTLISISNARSPHRITFTNNLGFFSLSVDGTTIGKAEINPIGQGGDFLAFPALCDIGYGAAGGKAAFSDIRVRNFRHPGNTIASFPGETIERDTILFSPDRNSQPTLRSRFRAKKEIDRARLYATARGIYDAQVNGKPVTENFFSPGNSQYNRTHYYNTFDITPLTNRGDNEITVTLGEGWWSGASTFMGDYWNFYGDRQSFAALIEITYTDGTKELFPTTPNTWEVNTSTPLLCASLFQGEVRDNCSPQRNEWKKAVEIPLGPYIAKGTPDSYPDVSDYSSFNLTAHYGQEVAATDTIVATSVKEVSPGVYIYDMGRNIAGVPLVTFRSLKPGQEVAMRFAEVLYPDLDKYEGHQGEMMMENIRAAMATDRLTAAGLPVETFSPRFTYHGYRYMEISGIDQPLPLDDVRGIVISSVDRFASSFTSSDPSLNRLWENIKSSMRANFISVPTDCPQRNERLGWSGDIEVFSPSALMMADCGEFLRRQLTALRDCQRPDGRFPDVAPTGVGFGGVLWGSAGITIPVECYLHYGDTAFIAENYEAMKRYIDYIEEKCIDHETGILRQFYQWGDLCDWLSPEDERNDKSLVWEAYFIKDLSNMEKAATALGKDDDAVCFRSRKDQRLRFFNDTYIDPSTGKTRFSAYDKKREGSLVDTQTSYLLPYLLGIVDEAISPRFRENMLASVRRSNIANGNIECSPHSLMTGFIGTAVALPALSAADAPDDAYAMLLKHGYPSWLYSVDQGATTIWERLNSYTHTDGFGSNNRMNSFNHYSFGAVAKWLISGCLGIERRDDSPGFKEFNLRPVADLRPGGLESASGHFDSPYGRIGSSWKRTGDRIDYDFEVPANTTATLYLPDGTTRSLAPGHHHYSHKIDRQP